MKNLKSTVTKEKREETIEKILKLIETEFEGTEVTALFTKVLLQEAIKVVEDTAMLSKIKAINHTLNSRS